MSVIFWITEKETEICTENQLQNLKYEEYEVV